MATLTNTKIKDTYDGLLKTTDNDVIGASEKVITDGLGNASVLSIGTASASFSSDIEVNGLTIGLGSGSIVTNTALGSDALFSNTSGSGNVSVGQGSMRSNTTGSTNIAVGKDSLRLNTTGNANVAVGYIALYNNIDGADNVAVGYSSLNANTSGSQNIAIGRQALLSNTTGGSNTAIGYSSLVGNITGGNNTAVGRSSLHANTASNNTSVGAYALRDNTTGTSNTAIGYLALSENTTGGYNTSIGSLTLEDNTTGSRNTAVGFNALDSNTEGSDNTAIGNGALDGNTTGDKNVAVGSQALNAQTIGSFSTAVGYEALWSQTTGSNNTAIGYASMRTSTTGTYNTAIGVASLYDNTTGSNNVAIGRYALTNSISGNSNIGIGTDSGNQLTTGSNNIYIGGSAVGSAATNDNEIVIGYNATGNGSNTATYGNASITGHHFTAGQVNVSGNLAVDTNTLYVDAANNRVGIGTSSPDRDLTVIGDAHIGSSNCGITLSDNSGVASIYGLDAAGTTYKPIELRTGAAGTGFYQDTSGNVGIGATPTRKLQVHEASATSSAIKIYNYTTGATVNDGFDLVVDSVGNAYLAQKEALPLIFLTSDTERMRIDSSGNVGIGLTSTNSVKLGITGNSGLPATSGTTQTGLLRLKASNNATLDMGADHTTAAGWLQVTDVADLSNEYNLLLQPNGGNVGIGATPSSKLTVFEAGASGIATVDISGGASGAGSLQISAGKVLGTTSFDLIQNSSGAYVYQRDSNPLIFGTSNTERMRIDSSGNVGINCSPSYKLDTQGVIRANTVGLADGMIIYGNDNNNVKLKLSNVGTGGEEWQVQVGQQGASNSDFAIRCNTTSRNVLLAGSNGNVVITSSNENALKLINSSGQPALIRFNDTSTTLDPYIGSYGNDLAFGIYGGGEKMRITSAGNVGIGNVGSNAKLEVSASSGEVFRADASGGAYRIVANQSGVNLNGNVGIGDAASTGVGRVNISANPSNNYQIEFFTSAGTSVGSITTSGGTTTNYNTSSDYRLKEDLQPIATPLDRVDLLNPVNFAWKTDGSRVDGFIAHELQEVIPEAVTGEKDAVDEEGNPIYQGIDQSKIVPLLVGAIKELRAEIELLKSQLNA